MRKNVVPVLGTLTMLPTPALAGGSGPGVGSLPGIIIIVAAAFIGYIICKITSKKKK